MHGEWMIPRPGPEHELTLERQRRAIDDYTLQQAQDMLWRLCQLSMQQDLILRAATRHIAELECREALHGQGVAASYARPSRDIVGQPDA